MHYKELKDSEEDILQGDIFSVGVDCTENFNSDEKYAVVITADCDIAQEKMGNYFTLLPIISLEKYIEDYWLLKFYSGERRNLISKHLTILNKANNIKNGTLSSLNIDELDEWLKSDNLSQIYNSLDLELNNKHNKDIDYIKILNNPVSLSGYLKIKKSILKKGDENIEKELISAATKSLGSEFVHIPGIPFIDNLGCIVKLRDVRSINKKRVYTNNFDIKLSEYSNEEVVKRVGRLPDYLRYSITQQFSTLFSRIGMPDEYEKEEQSSLSCFAKHIVETKV